VGPPGAQVASQLLSLDADTNRKIEERIPQDTLTR
jgi:hypothetical protein